VLVEAYLESRDEDAFRALYRRHAPGLWRMALRLARGAEEEAREIVQETWLRAARRLAGFRWESSLRTWLVGIALNCAREADRRAGRETPVADVDSLTGVGPSMGAGSPTGVGSPPGVGPPTVVDIRSGAASGSTSVDPVDLSRAIDALPDGYRRVLVLHDVEGYTHEEIGRLLGVEPGTSKSQLHRARARVRARLAEGGGA
jgi:RNA polymerase sigma-70 factor (ECF subfamily)